MDGEAYRIKAEAEAQKTQQLAKKAKQLLEETKRAKQIAEKARKDQIEQERKKRDKLKSKMFRVVLDESATADAFKRAMALAEAERLAQASNRLIAATADAKN